jgi:hypothetical protein
VEYEQAATGMADRSLQTVNIENNSNYTDLENTFGDTVSIWSNRANTHSSAGLEDAHVSVVATKRGTKIGQTGTRNFTDDNDNPQWVVANNTTARAFQMTVEQGSLGDDGLLSGDPEFAVKFSDGANELTLYIYDNGALTDDVTVVLYDDGTEINDCSVSADGTGRVSIDFSAATIDGGPCDPLVTLTNRLPAQYTVTYENGSYAKGNYSLIVNRATDKLETGADDTVAEPYADPALYSAELSVTYRSSVTYYRTNVQIAPEELDA